MELRRSIATLIALAPIALLGSCQSMAEGILSFEARALVYDDAELDRLQSGSSFDEVEVDLEGYGGHLALMTPIFDVLGGLDWREYDGDSTPEIVVGLRRRILEVWRVRPYVEGNLRYGTDLDVGLDESDYAGWAAGGGLLFELSNRLFLNARVMYEATPIEGPSADDDVNGLIGTVGLGLAF